MSCCYAVKSTRSLVLLQPPHELDGTMDSCREQFAAVNGNPLIRVITILSRCKSLVAGRFRVVQHFLRCYMLFYSHFLPKKPTVKQTRGAVQVLKSLQWRKTRALVCVQQQRCFTFRHSSTAQQHNTHSEETSASLHSYTL